MSEFSLGGFPFIYILLSGFDLRLLGDHEESNRPLLSYKKIPGQDISSGSHLFFAIDTPKIKFFVVSLAWMPNVFAHIEIL